MCTFLYLCTLCFVSYMQFFYYAYTHVQQWIIWKITKLGVFRRSHANLCTPNLKEIISSSEIANESCKKNAYQCSIVCRTILHYIWERTISVPIMGNISVPNAACLTSSKPHINFDYFLSIIDSQSVSCSITLEFNEDSDWFPGERPIK